jgi:chemotaxis protein MotB
LREAGFFESGSAAAQPQTLATLRTIAASLQRSGYDLRIEGHTDNVPIPNRTFDSNWELSAARATNIARMFLSLNAIAAEQLSAAEYAEFHPVASNDKPEGRAQNRRVDLVVQPRSKPDLSTPDARPSSGTWRRITDDD